MDARVLIIADVQNTVHHMGASMQNVYSKQAKSVFETLLRLRVGLSLVVVKVKS